MVINEEQLFDPFIRREKEHATLINIIGVII